MSFEENWPLRNEPDLQRLRDELEAICSVARIPTTHIHGDSGAFTITFHVPVREAARVVQQVADDTRPVDVIQRELEAPRGDFDWEAAERAGCVDRKTINGITTGTVRDEARFTRVPDRYTLVIEVNPPEPEEEIPPSVSVYSNEKDNREGWSVAVALAGLLAERLGMLPDERDN